MKGRNSQPAMESSTAEKVKATEDVRVSRAAIGVSWRRKRRSHSVLGLPAKEGGEN